MPERSSLTSKQFLAAIVLIGGAVGGSTAAFAYTSGWLSPGRLTPERIVDALGHRGGDPFGHRRNHAKGICFTGSFEPNGAGTRLPTARVFAPARYCCRSIWGRRRCWTYVPTPRQSWPGSCSQVISSWAPFALDVRVEDAQQAVAA